MNSTKTKKNKIREEIKQLKSSFTLEDLSKKSEEVISVLEILGIFQEAKNVFIYNSLPTEVDTSSLINNWSDQKNFYLPVVAGNDIVFRRYNPTTKTSISTFGIEEPVGENYTDYKKIDLIIVPGIAFDRKMNRIGFGKGYYDRFLSTVKIAKIGICFDFQLFESIPSEDHDVKMDYIISENDLIW